MVRNRPKLVVFGFALLPTLGAGVFAANSRATFAESSPVAAGAFVIEYSTEKGVPHKCKPLNTPVGWKVTYDTPAACVLTIDGVNDHRKGGLVISSVRYPVAPVGANEASVLYEDRTSARVGSKEIRFNMEWKDPNNKLIPGFSFVYAK